MGNKYILQIWKILFAVCMRTIISCDNDCLTRLSNENFYASASLDVFSALRVYCFCLPIGRSNL